VKFNISLAGSRGLACPARARNLWPLQCQPACLPACRRDAL